MSEKEVTLVLNDGGVDKTFLIKRMDAFSADKWARHLIKALTRAGMALPEDAVQLGMTGLSAGSAQSLFGQLDDDAADQAIASLRGTIKRVLDPSNPLLTRAMNATDIEDPATLSKLDVEAFRVHVGFFKAAAFFLFPLLEMLTPQAAQSESPSPA
ncbi:hypothetical protein [Asaia astilbis]|uniref:hypothetical protein n=1 Tax=Asaia astilbis TaxID=610244 RepID=UPI0006855FDB|nr:hypothetical protein [Asaia astilbis]